MQSNTQAAQLHAGRHTHRNILCAAHPDTHVQSHTFHPGRQVPHLPKVTHGQSCPSAQTHAREGRTPPGSARGPTHTPPESRPHSEPATRVRSPSPAPIHPATSSERLRRLHPPSLVGSGQILLGLWPTRDPSFREGGDVLVTHVRAATTADRDQSQAGADCACAPRGGPAGAPENYHSQKVLRLGHRNYNSQRALRLEQWGPRVPSASKAGRAAGAGLGRICPDPRPPGPGRRVAGGASAGAGLLVRNRESKGIRGSERLARAPGHTAQKGWELRFPAHGWP